MTPDGIVRSCWGPEPGSRNDEYLLALSGDMGVLEDMCWREDLQDYMRAMADAGFHGSAVMAVPYDHNNAPLNPDQRALNHNISVRRIVIEIVRSGAGPGVQCVHAPTCYVIAALHRICHQVSVFQLHSRAAGAGEVGDRAVLPCCDGAAEDGKVHRTDVVRGAVLQLRAAYHRGVRSDGGGPGRVNCLHVRGVCVCV